MAGLQFAQADAPAATVAKAATEGKAETVEGRITMLHSKLAITADEETAWTDVAKAMRENAAAMDLLVSERATVDPKTMTALDDLLTYQKFTQAHVDGLKNLISAFTTLYNAMPDPQKKVADGVFSTFNHKHEHGHAHS